MAFKATSRVTSCDTESTESTRLGSKVGRLEAGGTAGDVPVWRRSMRVRWSGGTCHVARWGQVKSVQVTCEDGEDGSNTMTFPNEPVPSTSWIS